MKWNPKLQRFEHHNWNRIYELLVWLEAQGIQCVTVMIYDTLDFLENDYSIKDLPVLHAVYPFKG